MILIPGLSSSGETWDTTVARYKDRFECHVLTVAGFAGVPRVPAPMLDRVREGIAAYIRKNKMERPVIIGHSLGGFLALDVAAKYPELPGRIVSLDGYPFFAGTSNPETTPAQAKEFSAQMRTYMDTQTQDMYERFVKSGMATRTMVEKESDFERIVSWGLATDRTAVADALAELMLADLREQIAKIKCPVLVLASYIGFTNATRASVEANLKRQFAKVADVVIQITDTAHHFIMWDDPDWMFDQMDRFLK